MKRVLLATTLVVLLLNPAGAEQYKPSYRPSPEVSGLLDLLMDYELRALGIEGLPSGGEPLSKEQYEALMERHFCFQNFAVPSAVYQSILQAEITELAMAGANPAKATTATAVWWWRTMVECGGLLILASPRRLTWLNSPQPSGNHLPRPHLTHPAQPRRGHVAFGGSYAAALTDRR